MRMLKVSPIIAAVMLIVPGCADNTERIETRSIEQIRAENGVPVRTEIVAARPFETAFSYYAVLTGIEETSATAMISDKVERILYRVGDHVTQDEIVVTFPTDNPAAKYYQAEVAHEHAQTTLKRIKALYESGGISLQEYDNTRTQYDVAKANWDAVQQSVRVKAPISGVLTNLAVQESDNVSADDVLFTIAKTHKLKTNVWASDHQIGDIAVGNAATASWRDVTLQGSVVQVDLSLDSSNQAYGVVIEFDNPENRMKSGINADIVIHGKQDADAIMIARKNILTDGETQYVYLAENDMAVKRDIVLGRSRELDVEVIQGLEPGDVLITEGQMLLNDTMEISVTD